jgi:transcriptional regulator with XRE-family HTH domain
VGVMLRQAREEAGVTQETLAHITKIKKSAISRLENHAEDVRLSTVGRVARALGKRVRIQLVEVPTGSRWNGWCVFASRNTGLKPLSLPTLFTDLF